MGICVLLVLRKIQMMVKNVVSRKIELLYTRKKIISFSISVLSFSIKLVWKDLLYFQDSDYGFCVYSLLLFIFLIVCVVRPKHLYDLGNPDSGLRQAENVEGLNRSMGF
jgi:hypothetical protein